VDFALRADRVSAHHVENNTMSEYRAIAGCRVSGHPHLVSVLDLGMQSLTGVFPKSAVDPVSRGPLELVLSADSGLLQLRHSFLPAEMYGENYGYRSGLNQSMVDHLVHKVRQLERAVSLRAGDTVLDIGSNDATLLKAYALPGLTRIGIDPTGAKFAAHYPADFKLVPDFYSAQAYWSTAKEPAKIITSIAMFYDLERPIEFAREVASVLADDGIWHFEQSYMPSMLRLNSYDTICHEHLEYYSLQVVEKIVEAAGLKIVDVTMNNVNGGSFAVTAAKRGNRSLKPNQAVIDWMLGQEDRMGLETPKPFRDFEERVFRHRDDLTRLIRSLTGDGKKVLGYGASTKGNVVLQFCGLGPDDIPAIAEVNTEKFGHVTPGSHIPIVSEQQAKAMAPDYFLVLPWHFKDGILRREKDFLAAGGKFIFPFPEIEIV
jgi:hypothetical protein